MKLPALIFLLFSLVAHAAPQYSIPASRLADWRFTGIPDLETIRATQTVYTNLPGVDGATGGVDTNGVFDASVIIQEALDNCPSNKIVVLPSGRLCLSNALAVNYNQTAYAGYRTLRGAGKTNTILVRKTSAAVFRTGINQTRIGSNLVNLASMVQGATNLAIFESPYNFIVGDHLYLFRQDENGLSGATNFSLTWNNQFVTNSGIHEYTPGFYTATGSWYRASSADTLSQAVKCVAISGTNITIWPPLYYAWTNEPGLYAKLTASYGGGVRVGIESLTMTNHSDENFMVHIYNSREFWMKDVLVQGCRESLILLSGSIFSEIRDCDFVNPNGTNISHALNDNMGIQVLSSCANKIENNIFSGFWSQIMFNAGANGNVISYNLFTNEFYYGSLPSASQPDVMANHIAHCMMNLYEGNVLAGFHADNYHGSSSHGMLYRNWIHMINRAFGHTLEDHLRAIDICRFGYFYSAVGNILGSPYIAGRAETLLHAPHDGSLDATIPAIYRLGFPYTGGDGIAIGDGSVFIFFQGGSGTQVSGFTIGFDATVTNTFLWKNNYDFVTETIADGATNIADSLVYDSTPTWWPAGKTWPPFDPANHLAASPTNILAGMRFYSVAATVSPRKLNVSVRINAGSVQ